jgi:hypothetical protein
MKIDEFGGLSKRNWNLRARLKTRLTRDIASAWILYVERGEPKNVIEATLWTLRHFLSCNWSLPFCGSRIHDI